MSVGSKRPWMWVVETLLVLLIAALILATWLPALIGPPPGGR